MMPVACCVCIHFFLCARRRPCRYLNSSAQIETQRASRPRATGTPAFLRTSSVARPDSAAPLEHHQAAGRKDHQAAGRKDHERVALVLLGLVDTQVAFDRFEPM